MAEENTSKKDPKAINSTHDRPSGVYACEDEDTIFLFGDITPKAAHEFAAHIYSLDVPLDREHWAKETKIPQRKGPGTKRNKPQFPITVRISSYGGEVASMWSIVKSIRTVKNKRTLSCIEGMAASAAGVIAISADYRTMDKNSIFMLHHSIGGWFGNIEDLKDHQREFEIIKSAMIRHFKENSILSVKEIEQMLKRDTYLSAEECLKMGLIDEIV